MAMQAKGWKTGAVVAFLILLVYSFPRLIISWLGPENPWTSYLYQYGFGLVVFLIGIRIILASGACRPGRGRDKSWFIILLGGFILYATIHAIWILLALNIPVKGGV